MPIRWGRFGPQEPQGGVHLQVGSGVSSPEVPFGTVMSHRCAMHWRPEDEVPDLQRQVTAVMWLKGVAQDQLEHGQCHGCRVNSAQALAELGLLDEMLQHVGVGDPRTLPQDMQKTEGSVSWPAKDPLGER